VLAGGADTGIVTPFPILAFVGLLAVLSVVGLVTRRTGVPYSVTLVLVGLLVSAAAPEVHVQITPELVLAALLPGLVFEAAFRIDVRHLLRLIGGVALLAVPGVVVSAALVAVVLNVATGMPLGLGLVVGAMISATDPAAVIDAVKRLRAPVRLSTLFEAESLFNDGTAIVVFLIALEAVLGQVSLAQGAAQFVIVTVGSILIGLLAGFAVSVAMSRSEQHLVEITLSVFLAYGTYVAADLLHLSGIIATVTAGIVLGSFGRRYGLSNRAIETIDDVWEFLAFLLTGLVFLLIGLAMTIDRLVAAAVPIAWAVAAITAGRAIVVYGLLGGAFVAGERLGLGPRLPLGWLHVIFWGGLRGAVAVALALSLPADFPQRELLQGLTFGVVLFTLVVQGTTAPRLLRLAGVTGSSTPAAAVAQ
jgi:CPA1 family monovalent cation:H+ antiporter